MVYCVHAVSKRIPFCAEKQMNSEELLKFTTNLINYNRSPREIKFLKGENSIVSALQLSATGN